MSFLYKALLKEQQSTKQSTKPASSQDEAGHYATQSSASENNGAQQSWQANPQMSGFTPPNPTSYEAFQHQVSQQGSQSNWSMGAWILIAILLLIVGGLSGYIAGNLFGLNNKASPNLVSQVPAISKKPTSEQPNEPQKESEQQPVPGSDNGVDVQNKDEVLTTTNTEEPSQQEQTNYEFKKGKLTEIAKTKAGSSNESVIPESEIATSVQTASVNENAEPIRIENVVPTAPIEDVPDELKLAFEQAVADLEASQQDPMAQYDQGIQVETDSTLTDINDLSNQERAVLPQIFYQMHIFASEPSQRWIKVNDKTLYEGEYLTRNLKLVEIRQDVVVWETAYRRFSQVALQDYK